MAHMSRLSKAIRDARDKVGLTQAEVAAVVGCSPNNYNGMENGNRPISIKTIKKLVTIPGYPFKIDELLTLKALEEDEPRAKHIFSKEDFDVTESETDPNAFTYTMSDKFRAAFHGYMSVMGYKTEEEALLAITRERLDEWEKEAQRRFGPGALKKKKSK